MVEAMEAERYFSFRWCPYNEHPDLDDPNKPTTLVEFKLEAIPGGTRLVISESGFSALPDDAYRLDALRQNTEGWEEQIKNIAAYVES